MLISIALLCSSLGVLDGFYVPGVAPVEFKRGVLIEVKAVKMTSTRTQLPYEYYSLPFCTPKNGTIYKSENLGESYYYILTKNTRTKLRFYIQVKYYEVIVL